MSYLCVSEAITPDMKRLFFPFLALIPLLSLASLHASACGREYFVPEKMPLHNNQLKLSALLQSPDPGSTPYWAIGFGSNIVGSRIDLFGQLAMQADGAKITDAGFDSARVISIAQGKDNYQLLSDYALSEIRVGNRLIARDVLEKLALKHPNEYNILANLSLLYELNGEWQKAIEYLEKALAINGRYQFNSEWIHLNILKQKLSPVPDYTAIIGLKNADFAKWFNSPEGFPQNADSLKIELAFQLHERIPLFGLEDSVTSQLLLDFCDIVAKHDGGQAAMPFYTLLAKNNQATQALVEKRWKVISQKTGEIQTTFRWASLIWLIPLSLFVLFFAAWINSKRKQRKS